MKRATAIGVFAGETKGDELVIHANGMTCRESFSAKDRPENFYMVGSMGLPAAIGLGVALAAPKRDVVIWDGDGNVLMNLAVLAQVVDAKVENFWHVCIDNEAYDSTGGQVTISRTVRLDEVARAAGYKYVARVETPAAGGEEALRAAYRAFRAAKGPAFLLVKVEPGSVHGIGRVTHTCEEITRRFRAACGVRE
ncbi:MAG: sulfopyruvate decarboxylase subunit beta [Deltaproteobacteria bacterium]|nr:sulfopyruvate decarboxylase subunit beta [Deltaproteobacteria bacterium]